MCRVNCKHGLSLRNILIIPPPVRLYDLPHVTIVTWFGTCILRRVKWAAYKTSKLFNLLHFPYLLLPFFFFAASKITVIAYYICPFQTPRVHHHLLHYSLPFSASQLHQRWSYMLHDVHSSCKLGVSLSSPVLFWVSLDILYSSRRQRLEFSSDFYGKRNTWASNVRRRKVHLTRSCDWSNVMLFLDNSSRLLCNISPCGFAHAVSDHLNILFIPNLLVLACLAVLLLAPSLISLACSMCFALPPYLI